MTLLGSISRRVVFCFAVAAALGVARPARACFDGYVARGRHLTLSVSGDSDWEPAHIRGVATWINPRVHVVAERDGRGRMLYKVLVGAFLERREAQKVLSELEREVGAHGFVRRL